jgi:hypothetical protein
VGLRPVNVQKEGLEKLCGGKQTGGFEGFRVLAQASPTLPPPSPFLAFGLWSGVTKHAGDM